MDYMDKIASMPNHEKVLQMAEALEKQASRVETLEGENKKLASELELEKLCTQVMDSGQSPWTSRQEALGAIHKIASEGKLDALKVSLELGPGMTAKVASGVSSETEKTGEDGRRHTDIPAARAHVLESILGGAVDG